MCPKMIFFSPYFQQTVAYLCMTVAYGVASSLVFHAYFDDSLTPSLLPRTKTLTLIAAVSLATVVSIDLELKTWAS